MRSAQVRRLPIVNDEYCTYTFPKFLTALLLAVAPAVLAGKCNDPIEAGSDKNCVGGNYMECVKRMNMECTGTCAGTPAGGGGAPCHTGCTLRAEQECALDCSAISSCEECKHVLEEGGSGEPEEVCSKEGKQIENPPTKLKRIS